MSEAQTEDVLLADFSRELLALHAADPQVCETTLLIHPRLLTDFLDYNEFLGTAEVLVETLELAASCRSRASTRAIGSPAAPLTTSRTAPTARLTRCFISCVKRA